jgi:predicted  nucleic acid-binding Zn-ribbon protein
MERDITDEIFDHKRSSRDRRNNIIVILLVILLILLVVLYIRQNRLHEQIVGQLNVEKDAIKTELTHMVASYDSLKTQDIALNDEMQTAQGKVKDLLVEIEQTQKISAGRIKKYQDEITTLRAIMRDYVVQVDSLNRRNEQLMAENTQVKEDYKKVENENTRLNQETQKLQKNLERAAQLEAQELSAEPINNRSKPTHFANRTEKIKISLTLSSNVTTKRGTKNIYIRIRRPDQILLCKSPNDLFPFEDLKIQYSAAREVNYEGDQLPVNIYWDNTGESEFVAGQYTVDVFVDGNNIGTTTFELK